MAKVLKVRNNDNTAWIEVATSVADVTNYLTQSSASSTYATINYVDSEISGIDLSPYLTVSNASSTYLTQSVASSDYATKEYADNSASVAAAAVVDAAPETLNTLNELAAALGDDENFATSVTTSLAGKLDISTASSTYLTQVSASTQYEKLIPYSSSTPSSPSTGDLWVDSSTTPPALKTYNGSSWVQLGSAVDDAQAIIAGSMFMG